jgi:hypothetical protein
MKNHQIKFTERQLMKKSIGHFRITLLPDAYLVVSFLPDYIKWIITCVGRELLTKYDDAH